MIIEILNAFKGEVEIIGDQNNIKELIIDHLHFYDMCNILKGGLNRLSQEILGESKLDFDHSLVTYDKIMFDEEFKSKSIEYCHKDVELLRKLWYALKNILVTELSFFDTHIITAT